MESDILKFKNEWKTKLAYMEADVGNCLDKMKLMEIKQTDITDQFKKFGYGIYINKKKLDDIEPQLYEVQ